VKVAAKAVADADGADQVDRPGAADGVEVEAVAHAACARTFKQRPRLPGKSIAQEERDMKTIVESFEHTDREWVPHARYSGVAMKHLVQKGAVPAGPGMSVHLVRVAAGCAIGEHVHEGSAELHLVLAGAGEGLVEGQRTDYSPGLAAIIPRAARHEVHAREDLVLLAVFTPELC
jgi:quercetin dioxygenase-like cupin family protein